MTKRVAIFVSAVVLIICVAPASATVVPHDSTLVGNLGTIPMYAEAVFSEGVWTYTYSANITGASANITGLTIGNLDRLPFSDATNNKNFQNPVFSGTDSIIWTSGSVPASEESIVFSFTSIYGPTLVDVTMWGGFNSSHDYTLGLIVPEPGSLVGLMFGGLGALVTLIRRVKST